MSSILAMGGIVIGTLGLLGWIFDVESLKSVFLGFVTMKFNTALCIFLLGASLVSSRLKPLFSTLALMIGGATLIEYLWHVDFGIDQLIFSDQGNLQLNLPGRMSIITAVTITLSACGILISRYFSQWSRLWQGIALVNVMLLSLALFAYTFGAKSLAAIYPYSTVAIHTAIALLLLNFSLLLSVPNTGFTEAIFSRRLGGRMARRLLPYSILTLLFLDMVTQLRVKLGLFDSSFDRSFIVTFGSAIMVFLVWRAAVMLNSLDAKYEAQRKFLQELSGHLQLMIDHSPGAVALFDREMRYLWVSQRWIKDFSLEGRDLIGRSQFEIFPEIPEHWKEILRRCLDGATEKNDEEAFTRADGRVHWLRWEVRPWRTASGEIGGVVIFSEDITEKKLAADAQKYKTLVEGAYDAILLADKDGKITLVNSRLEEMFGYREGELIGQSFEILIPEGHRGSNSTGAGLDLAGIRKDGSEFPVDISLSSLVSPAGTRVTAIIRDISERKKYENELRAAVAARETILSIVSHDLKNPVSLVDMTAQLMMRSEMSTDQVHKLAEKLRSSSLQMQRLISDLLDFGKIEAGSFSVEKRPVKVHDAMNVAIDGIREKIRKKAQKLEVRIPEVLPPVAADHDRVVQILWNLLGNAVKFTPEGETIAVEVSVQDNFLIFTVSDTGRGIAPEDLPHVFDRYWRAQTASAAGTGLGLAIVKGIVDAHGGRVWAESELGRGSKFYFSLPVWTDAVSTPDGTMPLQERTPPLQ